MTEEISHMLGASETVLSTSYL